MSDSWIIIVPHSPHFIPTREAQQRAITLFRQFTPKAEKIEVEITDYPRFIDCGENLSRVICPSCRADIDLDWWRDWLGKEFENNYPLHPVEMPCCHTRLSIEALQYDWPQGIARFSLEAMNPNISDLTEEQVRKLGEELDCKVLKILTYL